MLHVLKTRTQLAGICQRLGLDVAGGVSDEVDATVLRRCLLAGFFMNVAARQPDSTYKTLATRLHGAIHPSSALFGRRPQ